MGRFITELELNRYRGINQLLVQNIGDINLFLGNNNIGKTSILEAIKILSCPYDWGNIAITSMSRYNGDKSNFIDIISSIFQKEKPNITDETTEDGYELDISCVTQNRKVSLTISGSISEKIDLNKDILTSKSFEGTSIIDVNGKKTYEPFSIDNKPIEINTSRAFFKALMVPVTVSAYRTCVKFYTDVIKVQSKDDFIRIMQIFDKNITDINIIDDMIWIQNSEKGAMPLFSYGMGMQKALLLGMTITLAKDGILLVDEIETAIHTSALQDVFLFFIRACKEMNVQVFATTHSLEAVDNALRGADGHLDDLRIITLRKKDGRNKTYARVMTGVEALENREQYEMELRI